MTLDIYNPFTSSPILKDEEEKTCDCVKILIVDDNNFNIFSLSTILEYQLFYKSDSVSS